MNIGEAAAIFRDIENEKYTENEKIEAIYDVMNMPTHNSFSKERILNALRWLWHLCIVEENEKIEVKCTPESCECCQYIGDGDFICDELQELVVEDWTQVGHSPCPKHGKEQGNA